MKLEKYRLQKVLELKQRKYSEALVKLSQAQKNLLLAETELIQRQRLVNECQNKQRSEKNSFAEKMNSGIKSAEIVCFQNYLADLENQKLELQVTVRQQQINVGQAKIELEKKLNELKEANKDLKIIEKHKENWHCEQETMVELEEQNNSDEISLLLYTISTKG